MPTLEENVNRVKAAKTAIGNAITAKGGTVGANDGLEDFADDIASIPSSGGDVELDHDYTGAWSYANTVTSVKIPYGATSLAGSCFNRNISLRKVEIPSSVTSIASNSFLNCYDVTVYIDKPTDSIEGEPWGATSMTVIWND